jgi:hypothetical protein
MEEFCENLLEKVVLCDGFGAYIKCKASLRYVKDEECNKNCPNRVVRINA